MQFGQGTHLCVNLLNQGKRGHRVQIQQKGFVVREQLQRKAWTQQILKNVSTIVVFNIPLVRDRALLVY